MPISPNESSKPYYGPKIQAEIKDNELWWKIRKAAKTDPTLQRILDQAKVIYHLRNKNA
jgi:hypothetical protein